MRLRPVGGAFPGCKKAPLIGAFLDSSVVSTSLAHFGNVCRLRSFLPLYNLELDFITLGERLETASTDRAEVNEDIRSALPRDEAKSLRVVEPFDRSSDACH